MSRNHTAKAPGSHLPAAKLPQDREESPSIAQTIRNKQRWKKLSRKVRQQEPWCSDPFQLHEKKGESRPSKAVHHIIPIEQAPELAYKRDNLTALCTSCHNEIERRERSGEQTAHLFGVKAGGGVITFPTRTDTHTRSRKKSETDFPIIPPKESTK